MKKRLLVMLSAVLVLPTLADSQEAKVGSKEFERLKSLVGKWTGKMKMKEDSEEEEEFATVYRLVSGGSVLEERIFPNTPKEMVTMYHDKGGKLIMTHYCMLGNQPVMIMTESSDDSISFDFSDSSAIDVSKEMHMHSMVLTFVDKDTIKQDWVMFVDGKAQDKHPFTLKRVK